MGLRALLGRFAAGAGDELAAHLLAMHHAAVGYTPDARLWRTIARLMKYTPDRHLPRPVRPTVEYGQGCGHAAVRRTALEAFIHSKHLPGGLLTR
ncbi:hypothetical protein [Streptomyces sp. H39-C1]|uniref:hypothetical protein n=1 Tax=Streptomyces sp. H39-C1 TaxID=3004355 RepID=UPI0022AF9962|nr:hypothetical protein [Streptomyces sp. H39-C1]MCZ4103014.1 hypothetical protein [Streptomyces sp. H39-C1]